MVTATSSVTGLCEEQKNKMGRSKSSLAVDNVFAGQVVSFIALQGNQCIADAKGIALPAIGGGEGGSSFGGSALRQARRRRRKLLRKISVTQ